MSDEKQAVEVTTNEVVANTETATEPTETVEAQAEQETATPQEDSTPTVSPQEFLSNFDWQKFEEGIEAVEDDKLKEFEQLVSENFVDTQGADVVVGKGHSHDRP
jgi:small subunit ribosomal protein S1